MTLARCCNLHGAVRNLQHGVQQLFSRTKPVRHPFQARTRPEKCVNAGLVALCAVGGYSRTAGNQRGSAVPGGCKVERNI